MKTRYFLLMVGFSFLAACAGVQPQPALGEVTLSGKDGMRLHYVPAGAFVMGNDAGWEAQKPAHEVTLDAFWIDESEVTNRMYALCVQAGSCQAPPNGSSYTRENYYADAQYGDYPVLYVAWEDAITYCAWAGRALPIEAQWEKAARGTDGRLYPWGNQTPVLNQFKASFQEDTLKVGSYPKEVGPYGALDMFGNVWEWTADWCEAYPNGDPSALRYGQIYRVLRGGSFVDVADATTRYCNEPELRMHDIGFRCAVWD